MVKAADLPYQQDKRVMWKVKHERTADCVVAGFRWHKDGNGVGSLLLGLFDEAGTLQHVGVASSFTATRRRELVGELAPLRDRALDHHPWRNWATAEAQATSRMPGGQSRWSAGKDLSWEPLRPELVAEVRYEHLQAGRFRHGARLARFRTDREPPSCTYAQLEVVAPAELQRSSARRRGHERTLISIGIGGVSVPISHPDKIFFSEREETKLDLVRYYQAVAEPLMATMQDRPLLLERYPHGAGGQLFLPETSTCHSAALDHHGKGGHRQRHGQRRARGGRSGPHSVGSEHRPYWIPRVAVSARSHPSHR